jgi:choline dehydrogenase
MMAEKIADMIRGRPLPRSKASYYVANGAPVRRQDRQAALATA